MKAKKHVVPVAMLVDPFTNTAITRAFVCQPTLDQDHLTHMLRWLPYLIEQHVCGLYRLPLVGLGVRQRITVSPLDLRCDRAAFLGY